jgi:hypothetical protein
MSDTNTPLDDEENGLRTDAGNPSADRSHLIDEPPAQVDEDAIQDNAETEAETDEPGDIADAARD